MEFDLNPFDEPSAPELDSFVCFCEYSKSEYVRVDFGLSGNFSKIMQIDNAKSAELTNLSQSLRKDELWKSTCFEFFIKPVGGESYFEFNINPKLEWNFYSFVSERTGMKQVDQIKDAFMVSQTIQGEIFVTSVFLSLEKFKIQVPFYIHAASVLETSKGLSYWSKKHEGEKPDFHAAWNFKSQMGGVKSV